MTQELFLISDIARRLDVPPHRIAYLFLNRKVEEPKLKMGNRRVFTVDEARSVAIAMGRNWDLNQPKGGNDHA